MKTLVKCVGLLVVCVGICLGAGVAHGSIVLSDGSLTVTINDNTGSLADVTLDGVSFFKPTYVFQAYWNYPIDKMLAFLYGTQDASGGVYWRRKEAHWFPWDDREVSVYQRDNKVEAVIHFEILPTWFHVTIVRTYELIPGKNTLLITTEFFNDGPSAIPFYFAEGFDMEAHGLVAKTYNDVYTLDTPHGTLLVGRSIGSAYGSYPQQTLLITSMDASAIATGVNYKNYQIHSPVDLWDVFAILENPIDPDGAYGDVGLSVVYKFYLWKFAQAKIRYAVTFANGPDSTAQAEQYVQAAAPMLRTTVIPEPSSLPIVLTAGILGITVCCRRS